MQMCSFCSEEQASCHFPRLAFNVAQHTVGSFESVFDATCSRRMLLFLDGQNVLSVSSSMDLLARQEVIYLEKN